MVGANVFHTGTIAFQKAPQPAGSGSNPDLVPWVLVGADASVLLLLTSRPRARPEELRKGKRKDTTEKENKDKITEGFEQKFKKVCSEDVKSPE